MALKLYFFKISKYKKKKLKIKIYRKEDQKCKEKKLRNKVNLIFGHQAIRKEERKNFAYKMVKESHQRGRGKKPQIITKTLPLP